MVPWNEVVVLDDVIMYVNASLEPAGAPALRGQGLGVSGDLMAGRPQFHVSGVCCEPFELSP